MKTHIFLLALVATQIFAMQQPPVNRKRTADQITSDNSNNLASNSAQFAGWVVVTHSTIRSAQPQNNNK